MNDSIDSIEKLIAPQINVASLMASTTAPPRRKLSLDNRSLVSEGTTRLFKYGHEVPPEYSLSKSKTLPTSLSSQCSSASTESLNMNLPLDSLLPRDRPLSSKPQNLRVVSGAQFRLLHKGNQLKSCEQCEQFDRIHRKDKETIRALKLQINRIQSHYEDLKYTRNTDGVASSSSLNQNSKISPASSSPMPESAAISDDSDLSRKLQQVEDELGKIKRLLAFERSSGDALRQNMEEQKRAFASELQRVEQEGDKLRSELSVLRLQNAKLRSENDSLSVKYSDSERELQLCQRRLNDALLRLQASQDKLKVHDDDSLDIMKELQRVRTELDDSQSENRHLEHQLSTKAVACAQAEEQVTNLTQQLRSMEQQREALSSELLDVQGSYKAALEASLTAKKRCDVLEGTLKVTIQERDAAKAALSEQTSELESFRTRVSQLEAELQLAQQKLNDTLRRMAIESGNTKKALEKAITASVRLCVVAPTVNVNVSDGRSKFKSRLSEKSLKAFLETEIFSKYSFLFKQDTENASPTGEAMDSWLQRMLGQMQASIETHVNSAMDGSSL